MIKAMETHIPVLFEDDNLLVLDKPAGVSVVDENEGEVFTIKDWVRRRYNIVGSSGGAEDEFGQRFGIVHRLDKETSGVLLIARAEKTFVFLKGLFKFRRIHKEYQALVYGNVADAKFEIIAPIQRDKTNGLLYTIHPEGRESITEFVVKTRFTKKEADFSYLSVFPKTGRTHQIRVHLKGLGHPVVNDVKYANRALLKLSEGIYTRMMLHAKRLDFVDWEGRNRCFESDYSLPIN